MNHNPENERIKREYFAYLREAKRMNEASVDGVAKALHRFESYTRFRPFKAFHIQQAIAFKRGLTGQTNQRTGDALSQGTQYATLLALRGFFLWLAGRPGFKSRISYSDAEYFNMPEKESRVAKARREAACPTLEQISAVLEAMPTGTAMQRRDRALVAFTLLTGARDRAIASASLKHIDLDRGTFDQDAREVATKFSKSFITVFFPVGEPVRRIVEEWIAELRSEHRWGDDDPLFPSTRIAIDADKQFAAVGLERKHWSTADPIRRVFREAFNAAGLPYFNPHSFRNTLVRLGQRVCQTPEQFKAWSQNLGHEKVLTTFSSYGKVSAQRQAELIQGLGIRDDDEPGGIELIEQALRVMRRNSAG